MPALRILDSLSDPGSTTRQNEDAAGGNPFAAFVIDGATGLGGRPLLGSGSDAAWLASFAKQTFEAEIDAVGPVAVAVRRLNERVAGFVSAAAAGDVVERWALPTASFQMIRVEGTGVIAHGLGDCRLFLLGADGEAFDTSAIKDGAERERRAARMAIEHAGGLEAWRSLSEQPEIRDALRRARARHNQPGGKVWTLGTSPDAAAHIAKKAFAPVLPARGLLCTDGFSALADSYDRYDSATFVRAAWDRGLPALLEELRTIERRDDPDGQRFPRFKVSDDATALLFEIVP